MTAIPFDPVLSVFRSATNTDPLETVPVSAVICRIRSPELAEATASIAATFARAGGGKAGKDAIATAKRNLPAVTLAGTFNRRANAAWSEPSGLVGIDLDNLTVEELAAARVQLAACPWVACLWASPSGAGIKGAVRVPGLAVPDPARYTMAWHAVSRWLASLGLVNDPAAKDCARLAFLAYDPEAWCAPGAEVFDLDRWAENVPPIPRENVPHIPRNLPPAGDAVERRALAYIRAMPESVEGSNGSSALTAAIRALRHGFDLDGASLWRSLEAWNAERANPPWSRAELEHALASVEKVPPTRGRGWLLAGDDDRPRGAAHTWPNLDPWNATAEPPPFDPVTMLPADLPELAALIHAVAEAVQVPPALVAGASLGLASLACSRSVDVCLSPEWREPAPLWVLPLLRPGERKSASLGRLLPPLHGWMARERKALAEPLARFAERRRTMEARLCAVRARAAKEASPEKRRSLEAEAADLAADLANMPEKLAAPDLLVQSFTPEALRDLLELNGEKLGIVSAEADAAELMGSRYSDAGPNLDLLLAAHAGDAMTTRRAGGRVIPLERPAVGLVLCVQPEAVRSVLGDRAARGRGLVDRMLLIHPPSRMGSRVNDPPPVPSHLSEWWTSIMEAVLSLPWPGRVIVGHDGEPMRCSSPTRTLGIDPEARRTLWDLRSHVEPRLAEGADLAAVSGFASKLPGACARLALAFTILRDPQADTVNGQAMRAACAWAPFLLAHHRAVLGDAAEPQEAHHAGRLWRALERRGRPTMTARELFDLVRDSAVPDMASFRPILDLLAEHGAVRSLGGDDGKPGRPAERWEVHPHLLARVLRDVRDIPGTIPGAA